MRGPTAASIARRWRRSSPVEVLNQPLFNPTGGYAQLRRAGGLHADPAADPAAWASATLGGVAFEQGGAALAAVAAPLSRSLGQGLAHLLLALARRRAVPGRAAAALRLLGHDAALAICWPWLLPFILSVSFLGQFVGTLVQAPRDGGAAVHRHQPAAVLPGRRRVAGRRRSRRWLRAASFIFPSTSAIDGLVRINQMDATLGRRLRRTGPGCGSSPLLYGVLADPGARGSSCREGVADATRGLGQRLIAAWPSSRSVCSRGVVAFLPRQAARHAADRRHGPRRPRSASRRRSPAAWRPSRFAPARRCTRATCWPCSTIPSSRRRSARPRRRPRSAHGRSRQTSTPACAPRRSPSWPTASQTAEANLLLAEQQNARAVALAARDFASRQELDESTASLAKAQRRPRAQARPACRRAAPARPPRSARWPMRRVALAEATVADLQAKLDKTRLVAPVDGTVGVLVAELGEVVPVGKPVLTLEVGAAPWFAFTLREDALGH